MIRFPIPPMSPIASRNVAVIGAGAAGLIAAHELRQEGHKVVVFERETQVGGTWLYMPDTESDPIGIDPARNVVHSSLYASLRTNLPREVMGYRVFPFVAKKGADRDQRRFPCHSEVLEYLKDFARDFGIYELVRFGIEVNKVELTEEGRWNVKSRRIEGKDQEKLDEVYDAVVVCNGHYTEPRLAEIPGIESWPGRQIHSHNYRHPERFQDQVVVLIGSANSAADISRELSGVAKEVHISSRSMEDGNEGKLAGYDNIWLHPMIKRVHGDGSVAFLDGKVVSADIILHCTGYKYHFPFLETNGIVTVDDNRVGPLYKHIFPPALAPRLSFVGLPWKVVPFPLFELQSKWIAGLLSGRLLLPCPKEMMAEVEDFYASLEAYGLPKRYTHNLADYQVYLTYTNLHISQVETFDRKTVAWFCVFV
ncbi:OLC1v1029335C1 [Oldenlandia corymbosa var. corymbosa]|uniref:Flavin-containing monooxygenase n=1 Tax=Oldenlandia corymbosa var. corymbosa TaxID=529605 RepID=A0AAV1CE53_OLDCO|nr:OLC1v1029335C1 [Oldenlandia corymbosa var. corymbosa]